MKKINTPPLLIMALGLLLASCGPAPTNQAENEYDQSLISCASEPCTEEELNAPLAETEEDFYEPGDMVSDQKVYSMPAFKSSWGLSRRIYDKAAAYYRANAGKLDNTRYLTIIDMGKHSSKKRFFLFDLATGKIEFHNTSHGVNSDANNNGWATSFSNTPNSKKSSLGFYLTLGTYTGANGYSMRIRGLSSTNSNAEKRAVVVHPAGYVSNARSKAGRSWGCPALDPSISRKVIDRIKKGSLMLIDR